MENKQLTIQYCEYASIDELAPDEKELMQYAMKAAGNAYAPYSHFHVGAAVRLADGRIMTGSNQENIAYPSGLCAERVALFSAAHNCPDQPVTALAVVGCNEAGEYVEASPCGACRQVIAETELSTSRKMDILCYLKGGQIRKMKGSESLLPFGFDAEL